MGELRSEIVMLLLLYFVDMDLTFFFEIVVLVEDEGEDEGTVGVVGIG